MGGSVDFSGEDAAARELASIPVTWGSLHEIIKQLPPPPFTREAATSADWTAYEASLSDVQRQARRMQWVVRVIRLFERLYDDKPSRQAAHDFAWENRLIVHAAFNARRTKDEAVEALFETYETRREEAA